MTKRRYKLSNIKIITKCGKQNYLTTKYIYQDYEDLKKQEGREKIYNTEINLDENFKTSNKGEQTYVLSGFFSHLHYKVLEGLYEKLFFFQDFQDSRIITHFYMLFQ